MEIKTKYNIGDTVYCMEDKGTYYSISYKCYDPESEENKSNISMLGKIFGDRIIEFYWESSIQYVYIKK